MVLFSEMFVSELIGKPVIDRFEERIGNVKDILVICGQAFPKVSGLLVENDNPGKKNVILVGDIDLVGRRFVSTRTVKERVPYCQLLKEDILLRRDILDKQIVDTKGARVVRVNDIKLAKVEDEIRLIAVDVSMSGILRRLGLEGLFSGVLRLFRRKLEQSLIGFNYVEFLNADACKGELTIPHKRVEELHPSDIANIISDVHSNEKTEIFASLPDKTAAEALHELAPKIQAFLLTTVDTKKALSILNKMPVDEAADVLGDIPDEKEEELLRLMKTRKAIEIRKLLRHHDETAGGLMDTLIERNTPIPTEQSRIFTTIRDGQTAVKIRIFQGEERFCKDNELLGEFRLTDLPPAPKGDPKIEVTFEIDANGIVNVTARDKDTGKARSVQLNVSGGLSKEEIEKLKSEHGQAVGKEDVAVYKPTHHLE